MIDLYPLMEEIEKVYEQCSDEESVDGLTERLIKYLQSKQMLSKQYIKLGLYPVE